MAKYRKKPVVIEAWPVRELLVYAERSWKALPKQVSEKYDRGGIVFSPRSMDISTLEGIMRAELDDFVICGVLGELYPCKPDIFAATYEAVE